MSAARKIYRVYCYDAAHQIVTADWIDAGSDGEAIAEAKARGFASRCEIWDGKRPVAKLEAEPQQA